MNITRPKTIPTLAAALLAAALVAAAPARAQVSHTYSGNGATGFSGYLGKGSVTVTRAKDGDITFALYPNTKQLGGNAVALYLDTQPGGFASTATLADNGDPGHEIISGANTGTNPKINGDHKPSRSVVTFAPGFKADYALSFEGGYVGLFKLAAGKDNSLIFVAGATQKQAPYTLTVPAAKIGLAPGSSFKFVATLISGANAYRSNETLGKTVAGSGGPVPGFNGPVTFVNFETFPAPK